MLIEVVEIGALESSGFNRYSWNLIVLRDNDEIIISFNYDFISNF